MSVRLGRYKNTSSYKPTPVISQVPCCFATLASELPPSSLVWSGIVWYGLRAKSSIQSVDAVQWMVLVLVLMLMLMQCWCAHAKAKAKSQRAGAGAGEPSGF